MDKDIPQQKKLKDYRRQEMRDRVFMGLCWGAMIVSSSLRENWSTLAVALVGAVTTFAYMEVAFRYRAFAVEVEKRFYDVCEIGKDFADELRACKYRLERALAENEELKRRGQDGTELQSIAKQP